MIPSSAVSPENLFNTITIGFNFKNISNPEKQMPKALKLVSSYCQMKPSRSFPINHLTDISNVACIK